ncbi:MAG: hypothetical protein R2824_22645 [Saprospiraceae bacterium]
MQAKTGVELTQRREATQRDPVSILTPWLQAGGGISYFVTPRVVLDVELGLAQGDVRYHSGFVSRAGFKYLLGNE